MISARLFPLRSSTSTCLIRLKNESRIERLDNSPVILKSLEHMGDRFVVCVVSRLLSFLRRSSVVVFLSVLFFFWLISFAFTTRTLSVYPGSVIVLLSCTNFRNCYDASTCVWYYFDRT